MIKVAGKRRLSVESFWFVYILFCGDGGGGDGGGGGGSGGCDGGS